LHGDAQTGVTILCMDAGVDTGPILSQAATPIHLEDTAATLSPRLAELGAGLLLETLPAYLSGSLQPVPQDGSRATYAPLLSKDDGLLRFDQPAETLARRVRAFHPWPGSYVLWQGQPLKVLRAHPARAACPGPGVAAIHQGLPAIGASPGLLVLDEIQPAGKKAAPGADYLRGARDWNTRIFSNHVE
jgi:methionyl-tRNA formyltransferase